MTRARLPAAVIAVSVVAGAYALTRSRATPVIAPQAQAAPRPAGATLEVTYIANEGVLIAAGDAQVLIDGLHREYQPDYPFLPEPHRGRLETAQPPFDGVDVILVSHRHLDHFHPDAVGRYLRHNPASVLISSEQVVHEVASNAADYGAVRSRITAATPALREKVVLSPAGLTLELLGLGHGTGRHATIQNLGHLLTLGGKTLLHVGDADTAPDIFAAFALADRRIDVAFLPPWFLTTDRGAAIVRNQIKPKHIVAVHLPASAPERTMAEIAARFPDAVTFTALLDTRYF